MREAIPPGNSRCTIPLMRQWYERYSGRGKNALFTVVPYSTIDTTSRSFVGPSRRHFGLRAVIVGQSPSLGRISYDGVLKTPITQNDMVFSVLNI